MFNQKTGMVKRMCFFFRWAQNLRCLRIIHRAPSGQPWSRLNLLPSEALRRATHVRRLQFRSGEPCGKKEDETQKHPGARGEGVGVRLEMQPKALKWLV